MKTKAKKKRNYKANDATLINITALKKQLESAETRIEYLLKVVKVWKSRAKKSKKLERKKK